MDMSGMMTKMFGKEAAKMANDLMTGLNRGKANTAKYDVKKKDGDTIILNVTDPDGRFEEWKTRNLVKSLPGLNNCEAYPSPT